MGQVVGCIERVVCVDANDSVIVVVRPSFFAVSRDGVVVAIFCSDMHD
jgi:hypothetical protein